MIDVVTVFAPRPDHPEWRDYLPLLRLQAASAARFGHRHIVVTDEPEDFREFETLAADLPYSLMKAQIDGQCDFIEQWSGEEPAVFVDADCLITRSLAEAFDGSFDLGLVYRDDKASPIQNGAMYLAPGNKAGILDFFLRASTICGDHWGADQEAISAIAAPVPKLLVDKEARKAAKTIIDARPGLTIGFLNGLDYNVSPKVEGIRHARNPFVVHFKGETKAWMKTYAERFVLGR